MRRLNSNDGTRPALGNHQGLQHNICVSNFQGRIAELTRLEEWLLKDRCRLVSILGMGEVRKTALSNVLVDRIGDKFDYVIWKSLKNAPLIERLIAKLLQFLSPEQLTETKLPRRTMERTTCLINRLCLSRCLVVLDDLESLFCSNAKAGTHH